VKPLRRWLGVHRQPAQEGGVPSNPLKGEQVLVVVIRALIVIEERQLSNAGQGKSVKERPVLNEEHEEIYE